MADFPSAAALGARAFALLGELNSYTDEPGKITRLYLSPAHRKAADWTLAAMQAAGLTAHLDALGSVQGKVAGQNPQAPSLIIGSHIDTVKDGGRFDGNLGVIAGIVIAQTLKDAGVSLPFPLEVIAFGDEENVRFPTNLSTSAALAGSYKPEWLDARDADGVVLKAALASFGGDPASVQGLARAPGSVAGYLEIHIEQGPVLEAQDEPVGIVSAINAQVRAKVRVTGEAGHAGTVPMHLRKDALAAMAEMALVLEDAAKAHPHAVATIGVVRVDPGATNVVPGVVEFTVDFRAPVDATVAAMEQEISAGFAEVAARRGVTLDFAPYARLDATPMAEPLMQALATGIARTGANLNGRRMPSGAAHDALTMARLCPSAMLFVRNEKGISHSPLENMTEADAGIAIRVLLETVLDLAQASR